MQIHRVVVSTPIRACLGAILLALAGSVLVQTVLPTTASAQNIQYLRREISKREGYWQESAPFGWMTGTIWFYRSFTVARWSPFPRSSGIAE